MAEEEKDWRGEAEKWKALSRKHEARAKEANAEIERLRGQANGRADRVLRTIADLVHDWQE